MNSSAAALRRHVESEVAALGGPAGYRAFAVKHLALRTVIKESHGSPVRVVAFHPDPGLGDLVATVGGNQATVYDDAHMGDYAAVVVHFVNTATEHHAGGELLCATWVSADGLSAHPHGDAWLAVAGSDPVVQILSVAEARVVGQLAGHTADVVHLCGASECPGLLLSLSRDGNVRVWDARHGTCCASVATDATAAELHPSGRCFVTGHRNGRMRMWMLPTECGPPGGSSAAGGGAPPPSPCRGDVAAGAATEPPGGRLLPPAAADEWTLTVPEGGPAPAPLQPPGPLLDVVERIAFLPGGRMAAKAADGRIHTWVLSLPAPGHAPPTSGGWTMRLLACVRVPGGGVRGGGGRSRCGVGFSPDGTYLVAGTHSGEVMVYETDSGALAASLGGLRRGVAVGACALSPCCRHLLATSGDGFVVRYEYCVARPEAAACDQACGASLASESAAEEAQVSS